MAGGKKWKKEVAPVFPVGASVGSQTTGVVVFGVKCQQPAEAS